jgi:uncharacterized protein (DUF1800 family)
VRRAGEHPWAPYAPGAGEPWDLRRVVHLHRRAGFGATWAELQRDLAEGPAAALARLLEGRRTEGVPESFEETSRLLADSAIVGNDPARLQAWWLWRMLLTPDPLGERLALCWHNHFATSQVKVMDLAAMRRQNELFRAHARARFGELLTALLHDPALLVWLDAQSNRAEHPNENLARELMELFTLGVGHYGEHDVKEAARALTGWRVTADGRFHASSEHHDDGEKTILGRTGRWNGDDLVRLLLAEPATARRLAGRLCELFLRDELRTEAREASLAEALRASGLDVGAGVALVLRSRAFFSAENLGGVVLGPTQFLVGAVRALEGLAAPPSTLQLAEWCSRIGQRLFYPPTVFGWDGGRAWITTGSLLGRARFASELAGGALSGGASPVDALATRHRLAGPPEVAGFLARLLLGQERAAPAPADLTADARGRAMAAARFLSSPEAQLA